jgi:hypothetical protein
MRIFQYKNFKKWATEEGLTESDLLSLIKEMKDGLTGNNLGGNVYKKRIKLKGRGKSGGARVIIVYKTEEKAFFVLGFAKNEKADIDSREEQALKRLSRELFGYTNQQIETALIAEELIEIEDLKSHEKQDTKNRA